MDSDAEARFTDWATNRLPRLHRFAYLMCGDWYVAEDLVQEALAKAALRRSRIERADHPDAYVRKMITNGSRSRWRRHEVRMVQPRALIEISASDTADAHASRDELFRALRELPARQRAAVLLRYFEQLSEVETAAILGCSVGTVKSQTSKALVKLRCTMTTEELPC